ncbi:hypothetical protein NKY44_32470, partial [Sinorhizobium meliloti]
RLQCPVHSAHVGDEVEVLYRWHPYFGQRVSIRRVEERATGRFLKVLGPTGVVIAISGWMIDPLVCRAMTMGTPRDANRIEQAGLWRHQSGTLPKWT